VTRLMAGDRFVLATAGGGGRGDPRARPAALVVEDVANGKVSSAEAREAYGQNRS
jgi:N-methylhydantoinase B